MATRTFANVSTIPFHLSYSDTHHHAHFLTSHAHCTHHHPCSPPISSSSPTTPLTHFSYYPPSSVPPMNKITNLFLSLSLTTHGSTQHQSPYAWSSSFLSHLYPSYPFLSLILIFGSFPSFSYIHKVPCTQSPSMVPT